jgi:hypothetical protein
MRESQVVGTEDPVSGHCGTGEHEYDEEERSHCKARKEHIPAVLGLTTA